MKKTIKKSGQKIIKKLSRAGQKASEKSKKHLKTHFVERLANVKGVRLWILEWLLLVSAVILFAVIQQIWYRNSFETKTFASGGSYTEGTVGTISSMNPLFANTNSEKTLSKLLFSSLFSVDASGKLGTELADTLKIDSTVKKNLKWSDVKTLDANDVIFSFNLIKNPAAKTSFSSYFSSVKIQQIDDLSFSFVLPTAYPAFRDLLDFPILPEHILGSIDPALIYEKSFSTKPIGSGPFLLNATQSSATGSTVYLSKNPNYFRGTTMLSSFTLRTYANSSQIIDAINRSEITATAELSDIVNPAISNKAFYKKETPLSGGVFAFLNTDSALLSSKKVRQAIQQGIDVREIRDKISSTSALDYPILSQQMDLKFPELAKTEKEAAIKNIKESNIDLKNNRLQIATLSSGNLVDAANILKAQLEALGFAVDVTTYDKEIAAKEFFPNVIQPRAYDILIYKIDLGIDPDPFAYYHSSQASTSGFNFSNYQNSLVDDILLSARNTFNDSLRTAKYESFLRYWVSDVPAIGLYQDSLSYYFNRNTRNFSENSVLSSSTDRFSDILYWASEKSSKNRTP